MLNQLYTLHVLARALRCRCGLFLVFILGMSCAATHAQSQLLSPNATIRGDVDKLRALPITLGQRTCSREDCSISIPTIHVFLSVRGYAPVRIAFTEAEDTRYIRREDGNQSINDINERPILLRGSRSIRHSEEDDERADVPVAGTLYRDNGVLQLEIATTHMNRRSPGRLVVARAFIGNIASNEPVMGRAIRPVSSAFTETSCGTHNLASHRSDSSATHVSYFDTKKAKTKIFYLGTDFDRDFKVAAKCKTTSACNNKIVSLLNQASVFYQKPLNSRIQVLQQRGPSEFVPNISDAYEMLHSYQQFIEDRYSSFLHDGVNTGSRLVDNFAGFTGKPLGGTVIGIATLGVFCNNSASLSSNMLIKHFSDSVSPITIAHELGHNLNADHTYSGIMTPSVRDVGKKPAFSAFSVSQMSSYLNSWFEECRDGVGFTRPPGPDPFAPVIQLTVGPIPGYDFEFAYSVKNKRANCRLVARASESAATADQGIIVYDQPLTYDGGRVYFNLSEGINATNDADATVFFKAFYICSGSQIAAKTNAVSFIVPRDPNSYSLVTRSDWISGLRDRLDF